MKGLNLLSYLTKKGNPLDSYFNIFLISYIKNDNWSLPKKINRLKTNSITEAVKRVKTRNDYTLLMDQRITKIKQLSSFFYDYYAFFSSEKTIKGLPFRLSFFPAGLS